MAQWLNVNRRQGRKGRRDIRQPAFLTRVRKSMRFNFPSSEPTCQWQTFHALLEPPTTSTFCVWPPQWTVGWRTSPHGSTIKPACRHVVIIPCRHLSFLLNILILWGCSTGSNLAETWQQFGSCLDAMSSVHAGSCSVSTFWDKRE